jgi:hypothetical protein
MLIKTPVRYNERSGYIMDADGNYIASPMLMSAHEDTVVQQRREAAERIVTALNENADLKAQVAELTEANERYRAMLADTGSMTFNGGQTIDQPCAQPPGSQCWHDYDHNLYDTALEAYEALHPKQEEQDDGK